MDGATTGETRRGRGDLETMGKRRDYSSDQIVDIYKDNIQWAEEHLEQATKLMDKLAWTFYISIHKRELKRLQPQANPIDNNSDSPIKKIKEEVDIVEVIDCYTELKGRNGRYYGQCPLHTDRAPSLSVDAEKRLWHCFGCGKGGDIIDFVKQVENIDTRQAIKILLGNA
jgi:hypothetical protein